MKINDNRNLDIELKCGLEEYLMEDIDRQLEGFRNLDEPPYSEEYKKFVQNFFKRKKSLRKMQWKRRSGIAAIFICFCIFFSQNISAEIKKVFNNISTKQTEASFNIKKESMYVQYDFNVFPTEWDIIYLPNDMIGDYVVDKVEGDNSKIEIVFVNSVGDKLLYKLSKERVKLSDEAYEVMAIKGMTGYYYERENTSNLVLDYGEEGTVSIQMEAQALEKKDLVWIAKNIVSIYR